MTKLSSKEPLSPEQFYAHAQKLLNFEWQRPRNLEQLPERLDFDIARLETLVEPPISGVKLRAIQVAEKPCNEETLARPSFGGAPSGSKKES